MHKILLVEDKTDGMWKAIDGVIEAQDKKEKLAPAINMVVWAFKIHIVTCMRDAALWIRKNTQGDLITILDGQFPRFTDNKKEEVLYEEVITNLQHSRDPNANFLIPFSSYGDHNTGMREAFLKKHPEANLLSQWEKERVAIKQGVQEFLRIKK